MDKKEALEAFQRSYLDLYARQSTIRRNPSPPRFCAQYKAPHSNNALAKEAEKQAIRLTAMLEKATEKTAACYREKAEQKKRERSFSTGFFTHHIRQNKTSAPPPRRHSSPPIHLAPR